MSPGTPPRIRDDYMQAWVAAVVAAANMPPSHLNALRDEMRAHVRRRFSWDTTAKIMVTLILTLTLTLALSRTLTQSRTLTLPTSWSTREKEV